MTHTEKDLKNKKQEDVILYYFAIGVAIIGSLIWIYNLFRQPTKIGFSALLLSIWFAVTIYLVGIKQVTEKSEKKALWKIVIMCTGLIVSIIAMIVGIITLAGV